MFGAMPYIGLLTVKLTAAPAIGYPLSVTCADSLSLPAPIICTVLAAVSFIAEVNEVGASVCPLKEP